MYPCARAVFETCSDVATVFGEPDERQPDERPMGGPGSQQFILPLFICRRPGVMFLHPTGAGLRNGSFFIQGSVDIEAGGDDIPIS